MPSLGSRLYGWIDERTGLGETLSRVLDERVPGGARWAYAFGSCLAFLVAVEFVTGAALGFFYAPSGSSAWASVAYIQDQLVLGWFVRGLHSAGASAMVIVLLLHMLQVTIWGAYKKPRELNWLIGLVLLVLTLGFTMTGYPLPWDQNGFWGTQVRVGLLAGSPLIGPGAAKVLLGGDEFGNLTVSHFYALHVFVLPAAMVLFTVLHVVLRRRHGLTPSWRLSPAELEARAVSWWPHQAARNVVAAAAVLGLMIVAVVRSHGAGLEAPADPTSAYDARPEWFFLPLYQSLKLFPGALEEPAALALPALFVGLLASLPFFDQGASRNPRGRLRPIATVMFMLAIAASFAIFATREDLRSEAFQKSHARAQKEALRARELALLGVPPAGGTAVWENDPQRKAKKLYAERCAGCHLLESAGERRAPDLDGWGSRAWILGMFREPNGDANYGKTKVHDMKPVKADDAQIHDLVEYVWALGEGDGVDEAARARGQTLFSELDCDSCHEVDGTSDNQGPNLGGHASLAWTRAFIGDPSLPRFFGKKNDMPKFAEKLTAEEIDALSQLMVGQHATAATTAAAVPAR